MNQVGQPALAQVANEFVNQVFYGPLLREMRENQHNPYFGNGPGGKTFMRQLDMEMVKRMSGNKPGPIAQALIRQLSGNERAQFSMMQAGTKQTNALQQQESLYGRVSGTID